MFGKKTYSNATHNDNSTSAVVVQILTTGLL